MAESRAAKQARVKRERERGAVADRYLSRGSRDGLLKELVTECPLPRAGRTVLVRRLDLSAMAAAGVWPSPITTSVRRLMIDGALGGYKDDDRRFVTTAAAVARAACIVPPPALLAGELTVGEITPDMCRPLFVEADPDEDQFILRVLDVTRGATPEQAATETARALADADADGAIMVLQTFDLVALMHHVLENAPGAHSRFRLADLLAVGSVAETPSDGGADKPADQARVES